MRVDASRPGARAIEQWLTERISELVSGAPNEIDIAQPFATYGLNSVAAVGLAGELEEWLDVELPATILWDYPTIAALSEYLAR